MKMNITKKSLVLICAIALLSSASLVFATYLMTSSPVTGVATSQATLALTLDKASVVQGESWTLTATVSDGTQGITINFLEGSTSVGTAITGTGGIATLTLTPSVGSHTYTATGTHP